MKKLLFLFLLSLSIFSCKDEEELLLVNPLPIGCLHELQLVNFDDACDEQNLNQGILYENCDIKNIGKKVLSETSKSNFNDFCYEIGDEIFFVNLDGDTSVIVITDKNYSPYSSWKFSGSLLLDCTYYCLIAERASIKMEAPTFSFKISLLTNILPGDISSNPLNRVVTSYHVETGKAFFPRKALSFNVEDNTGNPISPNNAGAQYHSNYSIYGNNNFGVFSNEGYNDNGWVAREEVYFHPQNGLVAVRDSLGEYWLRR